MIIFFLGPGKIFTMMQQLQKECDRQARKILEHFKRNRDFDHKVNITFCTEFYQ